MLATAEELAIDNAKEQSWMAVHEHERDLLELLGLNTLSSAILPLCGPRFQTHPLFF